MNKMVSEFTAHPSSKRRRLKHDIITLGTEVGINGRELKKKIVSVHWRFSAESVKENANLLSEKILFKVKGTLLSRISATSSSCFYMHAWHACLQSPNPFISEWKIKLSKRIYFTKVNALHLRTVTWSVDNGENKPYFSPKDLDDQ